jgi:hydrogenase nickel incorporation protein HypA/HybF
LHRRLNLRIRNELEARQKEGRRALVHELVVTKCIHQIVIRHALKNNVNRVVAVTLEIGALSDLQNEWIQRYFDKLNKGTVAEGAKLKISRVPAVFRCHHCQETFEITSLLEEGISCPRCQRPDVSLISGREYHIRNMEAH